MGQFHRIHMRAPDGDYVTLYVPLHNGGWLDPRGHRPWLLKALWDDYECVGELVESGDELNRIFWGGDAPDSLTDLGTAPLKLGAIVSIHEGDTTDTPKYLFVVRDLQHV